MNSSQLLDDFFSNIPRLKQVIFKGFTPDPNGPTHAQMGIMFQLSKQGPKSIKDIAEEFGVTSSGITQMVDGLVKQGWATRQEAKEDRRRLCITLSASGNKVLKQIHKARIAALKKAFSPLTDEEIRQLYSIQKKLIDHL